MAAIQKIKLPTGEIVTIDEWIHWPLFSTIEAAAATSVDLRAFSYVVGQNIPQAGAVPGGARTATDADTNQVARGRMNHDEAFICFSLTYEHFAIDNSTNFSAYANPPADTDAIPPVLSGTFLKILQLRALVSLFVGAGISKPQYEAPLSYIGQGVGSVAFGSGDALTIAVGGATSLNLNYGTGGMIDPVKNQRRWPLPVYIHKDRTMHLRMQTPDGAGAGGNNNAEMADILQAWRLRFYLDGLKQRPVA